MHRRCITELESELRTSTGAVMVEVTVQVTVEVEARTPANSILDRERQRVGPSARVVVVELRAEREREYRWRGFLYVFRHDHFLNGQADIFGEFVNFGTQHVFFFSDGGCGISSFACQHSMHFSTYA